MGIPVQANCDPAVPEEHVLWALVNVNGDVGAPLLLPEPVMRAWSKHLYECGFRHDPLLQRRWYEPPGEDVSLWGAVGGRWVESEPEKPDEVGELLGSMSQAQRADLKRRLLEEDGEVG